MAFSQRLAQAKIYNLCRQLRHVKAASSEMGVSSLSKKPVSKYSPNLVSGKVRTVIWLVDTHCQRATDDVFKTSLSRLAANIVKQMKG